MSRNTWFHLARAPVFHDKNDKYFFYSFWNSCCKSVIINEKNSKLLVTFGARARLAFDGLFLVCKILLCLSPQVVSQFATTTEHFCKSLLLKANKLFLSTSSLKYCEHNLKFPVCNIDFVHSVLQLKLHFARYWETKQPSFSSRSFCK